MKNKQQDNKQILQHHKPHILGLGEANFKSGHNLTDVEIPGYKLHLHQAWQYDDLDKTARLAVYTHELLRVKRRPDLENKYVSALGLECGLPQQKSILIGMAYRQWRLLGQKDESSASVRQQLSRWSLFLKKWKLGLLENKEVLVMMDANLDQLT